MKTFTYWTVADKDHAKMASTMVASARAVGVKETVNPAIVHCMRGKNGLINKYKGG